MAVTHQSKIEINIGLDENKVPETLSWQAQDDPNNEIKETKAVLLSLWDPKKKETLRVDLWTKDMPIEEMKFFYYQTMASMSQTFERATNDSKIAAKMKAFCEEFANDLGLQKM